MHISCDLNNFSLDEKKMGELTKLQIHKHTFTCKNFTKSLKTECRFGIPFMPMKKTIILEPLLLTEINDVKT